MPTVYAYNASDGIFYARDLDGNAQTADNYASGFFGFIGAAADATHIYAFNNAADEVVIWDRDWTVMNATITPNSPTDSYRGIALSDTHLILLNHTANQLEFYSLTGYIFESALTVSLDSKNWGGAARGADYLFLGNNTDDDIDRRSLDGTADIDFSTGLSFALQSIYASDTRVWVINRTGGAATAFDHDGTAQSGDNHAWGSGNWQAAFVQPDEVASLSFGSETIDNQAWEVDTAITSVTLPEATGGTGTITYSLSPTVPAGITFSAGNRRVSGTPTGRFTLATFTYTATDEDGTTTELTFTIVVTAVAITFASTVASQAWVVGTAVSLTLPTASGGVGTLTYSLTPTLPAGTTFTTGTRVLAGTPTGRFNSATFTYTATDAESITHTQTFTIVVTATAITFNPTSFSNQMWTVNMAVSLTLPEGSGGVGTLTATLTGTLPSGISFTASTRALAGNPSAVFASATFTYTMTDTEGESESISFTILVDAAPPPTAGYFYDLEELEETNYPDAEMAVAIPNAAGDDAIAKRAPRSIARSLLLRDAAATYTLIQSLLDYDDLLNRPTIPTLRDAAQTYALIQSLLDYDDLQNRPNIPTLRNAAQTYALIQSLLDYADLSNRPTTISTAQANKLAGVNFHEWDSPNITNADDFTLDQFIGNAIEVGNGVKFEGQFRFTKDDGELWTIANPRLELPVPATPTRMTGGGQGYGGSEQKFFDTQGMEHIDIGAMGATIQDMTVLDGTLYALDTGDDIRTVNRTTGATTEVNNSLSVGTPYSMTAHDGDLWVAGSQGLFQVDGDNIATDTGTEIGDLSFSGFADESLLSFNGNLYYWETSDDHWYQINEVTGATTQVGQSGMGIGITSVYSTTVKDGKVFMVAGIGTTYEIYCFTDIEGTAEQFGDFTVDQNDSLAWHDGDQRMYFEDQNNLEYIDLYDPPIMSVDFSGDDYTTAIANIIEASNLIELEIEKLQRNDSPVFINFSGSYKK